MLNSINHNEINMKYNELNKPPSRFNIVSNKIYRKMFFELDTAHIEKLVHIKLKPFIFTLGMA